MRHGTEVITRQTCSKLQGSPKISIRPWWTPLTQIPLALLLLKPARMSPPSTAVLISQLDRQPQTAQVTNWDRFSGALSQSQEILTQSGTPTRSTSQWLTPFMAGVPMSLTVSWPHRWSILRLLELWSHLGPISKDQSLLLWLKKISMVASTHSSAGNLSWSHSMRKKLPVWQDTRLPGDRHSTYLISLMHAVVTLRVQSLEALMQASKSKTCCTVMRAMLLEKSMEATTYWEMTLHSVTWPLQLSMTRKALAVL